MEPQATSARLVIRPAVTADADVLTELARRSKAHWGYSEEFMRACEDELTYRPEQIERDDASFVVGEVDGVVIGFYALSRVGQEYELDALFIEPGRMRQGLGLALLEHARGTVRLLGGDSLVVQGDPHAEGFYLAAGASRIGTRESASVPHRYLPLFRISV